MKNFLCSLIMALIFGSTLANGQVPFVCNVTGYDNSITPVPNNKIFSVDSIVYNLADFDNEGIFASQVLIDQNFSAFSKLDEGNGVNVRVEFSINSQRRMSTSISLGGIYTTNNHKISDDTSFILQNLLHIGDYRVIVTCNDPTAN